MNAHQPYKYLIYIDFNALFFDKIKSPSAKPNSYKTSSIIPFQPIVFDLWLPGELWMDSWQKVIIELIERRMAYEK